MFVEWTPDLSVGVDFIDDQHKELFKRVKTLLVGMSTGQGSAELASTVKFLGDYVVDHFSAEENLMDRFSYGNAQFHKAQHTDFIRTFGQLKEDIESRGATAFLVIDTQKQLVQWLTSHIGQWDVRFGKFLMDRQRKEAA